jgi:hypothetical protein
MGTNLLTLHSARSRALSLVLLNQIVTAIIGHFSSQNVTNYRHTSALCPALTLRSRLGTMFDVTREGDQVEQQASQYFSGFGACH